MSLNWIESGSKAWEPGKDSPQQQRLFLGPRSPWFALKGDGRSCLRESYDDAC